MQHINDPRQNRLFDVFEKILSPLGYKQLQSGWQRLFRETILELMPVNTVKEHFDPVFGQPTKELYSMCGLIFIMEFLNWTIPDAADAYMFRADIQYALNLDPENQSMSTRTVERYKKLIVEDELAGRIMDEITRALIAKLDLSIEVQRLDSTHVFSDMAQFGRTRMMGVAIKRFLTQLRRHDEKETTTVVMGAETCAGCPHRDACPVKRRKDGRYECTFTDKQRRLDARRREEDTEAFRERYRKRSGIEATNAMLKRVTAMGRLRVRGSPSVFHSIRLKVAGWNLFQAARALAMRQRRQVALAPG